MHKPVVYDKAKYHDETISSMELDEHQAFVHTGMFLGWLIERNLCSDEFLRDNEEVINSFKNRLMTGSQVYAHNDGVLIDDMLNEEGNAFAQFYFDFDEGQFLNDWRQFMCVGLPSEFNVQDTWENYDKIKFIIHQRYMEWKQVAGRS
jgi:hypothetical protein